MTSIRRFILSSIVCGGFAAGCVAAPADEQPAVDTVETVETEQSLGGASTQAQERLVTYYNEAAMINVVGSCFGPYRCFGPKGTTCTGRKTAFFTVEWFDCGGPEIP